MLTNDASVVDCITSFSMKGTSSCWQVIFLGKQKVERFRIQTSNSDFSWMMELLPSFDLSCATVYFEPASISCTDVVVRGVGKLLMAGNWNNCKKTISCHVSAAHLRLVSSLHRNHSCDFSSKRFGFRTPILVVRQSRAGMIS